MANTRAAADPVDPGETEDASGRRVVRAGFQGREGSFGARAAAQCGRPVPAETFGALFVALGAGAVDEALLPVVDRVIGPVDEALSALAAALDGGLQVAVLAEVEVPMRLVLAAPRGVGLGDVAEVFSQAPVLRQCGALLARLGAAGVEAEDTAAAASWVAELGGARAAVCSEEAALEAGLVPLLEDVSDVRPNGTRFWRLAAGAAPAADAPRVLRVPTERLAALLAQAGAELLHAGGRPAFAVVADALLPAAAAAIRESGPSGARWLGPPPEAGRRPKVEGFPV